MSAATRLRRAPRDRAATRRGADRRNTTAAAALSPTSLLQLMRLASPSLPVGGFSYSEGLESAVDAALVVDEATALAWLVDQLRLGLARADLPVVARALAAWRRGDAAEAASLNRWFATTRESAEMLRQ